MFITYKMFFLKKKGKVVYVNFISFIFCSFLLWYNIVLFMLSNFKNDAAYENFASAVDDFNTLL